MASAAVDAAAEGRPTAAIYREFLVPSSETFILNQTRALRRYQPILVGRRRIDGLDLRELTCEVVNPGDRRGGVNEVAHRLGFVPRTFARRLARRRPRLLHAHFGPDALNALPLCRRLGLPLIVTFHGYDAYQQPDLVTDPRHWVFAARRSLLAREATCVLTASAHMRERLLEAGFPAAKVRAHYIGVDTKRFAPGPSERREPVVLGVGRFVEKKGFADLIEAMSAVVRAVPRARLVLVGGGPLERALRERARGAAPSAIEFTGPLPPSEVIAWMRRASVIAVPSVTARSGDTEATTMTVLEGMASGLPAVATRHGGIPETVSDDVNGLLVPERDRDALAAALVSVLSDHELWRRLSAASRRVVEERFDLATQTRRLEDIYDEVAARAGSSFNAGARSLSAVARAGRRAPSPAPPRA